MNSLMITSAAKIPFEDLKKTNITWKRNIMTGVKTEVEKLNESLHIINIDKKECIDSLNSIHFSEFNENFNDMVDMIYSSFQELCGIVSSLEDEYAPPFGEDDPWWVHLQMCTLMFSYKPYATSGSHCSTYMKTKGIHAILVGMEEPTDPVPSELSSGYLSYLHWKSYMCKLIESHPYEDKIAKFKKLSKRLALIDEKHKKIISKLEFMKGIINKIWDSVYNYSSWSVDVPWV